MKKKITPIGLLCAFLLSACGSGEPTSTVNSSENTKNTAQAEASNPRFNIYKPVTLQAELTHLSQNQKKMISKLIDASKIMDELFWLQAYGDKTTFLSSIEDEATRLFAEINYGPWDRLAGDSPFIEGYQQKPLGARFYPSDMTKAEFEAAEIEDKKGLYSLIKRDSQGKLYSQPYHQAYSSQIKAAAQILREAAELADNQAFKNYLQLRATALETDQYQVSDLAWMDMKSNPIELVLGPIETYEDQLFGYRAAYESYVLLKDLEWSEKLAKFAAFLPKLQQGLPVEDKLKAEIPGTDSDLNAYDVVYYAGHSNAGSKTIAINLPNDEQVQLAKGTRRLQLKNAMQAKFEHILLPIAEQLIAAEQRQYITFDAFFANTMFHEVAHGLGIKNTINGNGTVRSALKETASALEEGKADILGLYMISELYKSGDISEGQLMDNYVTFLAGIFRSVRFGASSAHGKANMVRFNFFEKMGAFKRNPETGFYQVNFDAMTAAMNALSNEILTIQGNGDYQAAKDLLDSQGVISKQLSQDLAKLEQAAIPVDIVFKQGKKVLGL
jgi:hypothetical protein